jgi:hypothetical protein
MTPSLALIKLELNVEAHIADARAFLAKVRDPEMHIARSVFWDNIAPFMRLGIQELDLS